MKIVTQKVEKILIVLSCYNYPKGDDSMNKYTYEQKQDIINRYVNGESVLDIVTASQIPRSTVYS